jgi:hypothetical protein
MPTKQRTGPRVSRPDAPLAGIGQRLRQFLGGERSLPQFVALVKSVWGAE